MKLEYKTDDVLRIKSKHRRDERRSAGVCICGPLTGSVGRFGTVHGPVVSGGRCQRCIDVHRGRTN